MNATRNYATTDHRIPALGRHVKQLTQDYLGTVNEQGGDTPEEKRHCDARGDDALKLESKQRV